MSRYIDADAFLIRNEYFADRDFINPKYDDTLRDLIDAEPTADVVEVRHGRWMPIDKGHHFYDWECSICGGSGRGDYAFCPNCGASMVNEDE